ncbi:hypothetical protein OG943_24290 [Amycolatopsis sp. NBC_00345]|uniref:hypothetical protein n=1 Tax=Amycolatopsis sp. NBC_00345 TaxID=2975955 RepID=UPI002E269284
MRIDGRHGSYEFDDVVFATGGAAHLFHGRGRDRGLVYKRYFTPIRDPEPRRKLLNVVDVGRNVFPGNAVALGSSPQASVCWPTDVEHDPTGAVTGVVMPLVPGEFFRPQGNARTLTFMITARANPPSAWVRVSVLIRVAEIFAWLSANGLAHGDFSDANIVWREAPSPGAVLIDADGLQPADRIEPKGMKTPHWVDPRVVTGAITAHDRYSDWYALALAMYRGLLLVPGNLDQNPDGSWPRPSQIPAGFPAPLAGLLHRTLSDPLREKGRATPAEWVDALREAFLLNDTQFDDNALRQLDLAADAHRPPPPTTQFQPLPPVPQGVRTPQPMPTVQQSLYPPQYRPQQAAMVQPPARSSYVVAAVVVLGLLVVLVGAGVMYTVSRGSATAGTALTSGTSLSTGTSPSTGTSQSGAGPGYYVPDPSTSYPAPVTTTETAPATVDADPEAVLRAQAAADYPQVEELAGQWVPQLSSKAVGTQDDGITYGNAAILAHYRQLKSRQPSALLLSSGSYSTFKNAGYWVIVLPQGYTSGPAANSWCDAAGIDANNCFAKLLSHTSGPQGATLNRS